MNCVEKYKAARDYDENNLITINKMLEDQSQSNETLILLRENQQEAATRLAQSSAQYNLVVNLSRLPIEIKKYIGKFSNDVINQQKLVKIEFYNDWFKIHKFRIMNLMKFWSKKDLAFALDKISQANTLYCSAYKPDANKRNQTNVMLLSKIECIINKKGQRSNVEMYGLLLAISNYHTKMYGPKVTMPV